MSNPSVMVLVKNESFWLPYVLSQTEGFFSSYCIYDVGSTDNTREIIEWFTTRMEGKADMFVRLMPDVEPKVQGAFRNSMIPEGRRDVYFILDGDELYTNEDLGKISAAAEDLNTLNSFDDKKRFGVFKRVEVNFDLTKQYSKRRSHHRLYTRDAFWHGNHPGEVSGFKQNEESEEWYDITCWHLHNSARSPSDEETAKRIQRKAKKTYHPGELIDMDLLAELPILRKRIENFPVCPALEALWLKRDTERPTGGA